MATTFAARPPTSCTTSGRRCYDWPGRIGQAPGSSVLHCSRCPGTWLLWLPSMSMGFKALRLNEYTRDLGMGCLDATLNACHDLLDLPGRNGVLEVQAQGDEHILRAEMHGQHLIDAVNVRLGGGDCADAGANFRIDGLARQQALAFVSKKAGRERKDQSDHKRSYTI